MDPEEERLLALACLGPSFEPGESSSDDIGGFTLDGTHWVPFLVELLVVERKTAVDARNPGSEGPVTDESGGVPTLGG